MNLSVEAFEAYLRAVKAQNTAIKYAQSAERFLEFVHSRQIPLDRLPPGILANYAQSLVEAGLAPRSIHVMIAGAKSYLEWCRGQGESIPMLSRTDGPKILDSEPNTLHDDALMQFFEISNQAREPIRSALLLLPYSGLRSEELATTPLAAIRPVQLPVRGGGHQTHIVLVTRGKGGDLRIVPILAEGRRILLQYLHGWRKYQAANSPWLFPMPDGYHVATRTLRHYVQGIRQHIGAKRLTPHTLRRTYLTALWRSGVDIVSLTKIAGHKSVQTTMKHYLEMRPEDAAGAVDGASLIVRGPEDQLANAHQRVSSYLTGMKR